ncbi:MAG TPA: DegT/DnrJ/EryC1/StrS family aminotransferase [Dehalococcoidia bacterium]|nr:DegT/DnrJ/EryC1/StrS family aminotransferase [Dehalococcoidia bacterium]
MRIPLVDLKKQYQGLKDEILAEIGEALEGMQLFLGKNVQAFESGFAKYCGTESAIGVGSGTDALHLALLACGIGPGDEVITVSNTFFATVEAIALVGARPIFIDIDPDTYNMDPSQLEEAFTSRTRAIIPVHLYGQPADMDPILELARAYKIKVIEDACQAHGAEYKGRRTGSLGDVGCFSFYFTKNLGAYGEAGMITTSDPEITRQCRLLRDHGQEPKYYHSTFGVNDRLDEIQAAILKVKLPHLDGWIENRRNIAQAYNAGLPESIAKPQEKAWAKHVYHLYVIRTPYRNELRAWLETKGIGTGMHYPIPIHLQEAWHNYGGANYSLPVTERVVGEILSLPMYPELSTEEVDYICDSVKEFTGAKVQLAVDD